MFKCDVTKYGAGLARTYMQLACKVIIIPGIRSARRHLENMYTGLVRI